LDQSLRSEAKGPALNSLLHQSPHDTWVFWGKLLTRLKSILRFRHKRTQLKAAVTNFRAILQLTAVEEIIKSTDARRLMRFEIRKDSQDLIPFEHRDPLRNTSDLQISHQ
jgi:hypothetical protein